MSARELSQLSLPQIASAVASGEIPLDEAEAELRRRPVEPSRPRRPPRPTRQPGREELGRLLEETRNELKQTAKRLSQLGKRLEVLTQMVEQEAPKPRRKKREEEAWDGQGVLATVGEAA